MNREDIIRMAREAEMAPPDGPFITWGASEAQLERFFRMAQAAEREACAKLCEQAEIPFDISVWHDSTKKEMTAHTAIALAAAIRARGQQ